jgi:hypothetical protein
MVLGRLVDDGIPFNEDSILTFDSLDVVLCSVGGCEEDMYDVMDSCPCGLGTSNE